MTDDDQSKNNTKSNTAAAADVDSDDSNVVMVEHDDAGDAVPELTTEDDTAKALQIVSIGTEADDHAFHFDQAKLNVILKQIPVHCPVAVLSVVGAFRTGKSFLLSWFLRYLNHLQSKNDKKVDLSKVKDKDSIPWYKEYQSLGNDGFEWKAGSDRNTTGIWMWSRPFYLPSADDDQAPPTALLLVDTQGMFDHETTMSLTASIFGFSTLLSSFQIYNVDKRIQEDNLQQLALFAEYARIAVNKENAQSGAAEGESHASLESPFQRMEFLVRDWQHFEDDDEASLDAMEASMMEYLNSVLKERSAADLKDTRDQIMACFSELTCFGLCHPGFAVTKKKFTGDVNAMEELFVQLLDRYCQRVFTSIQPKKIHQRTLTAVELGSYIAAYAALFSSGAHFPTAVTLLEATAAANNSNAVQIGIMEYQSRMDRVAGPKCTNYLRPEDFEQEHAVAVAAALSKFADIATFGADAAIKKAKISLQDKIHDSFQLYESLNNGRNPLAGMEMYLVAFFVGLASYLVRTFLDFTCAPHATVCRVGSELAHHASAVVWCFLAILAMTRYQQLKQHFQQLRRGIDLFLEVQPQAGAAKPKAE